jgi:hypothetical protein
MGDVAADEQGRLWFRLDEASYERATRIAVAALAVPREPLDDAMRNIKRSALDAVELEVLHGLADIAITGGATHSVLVQHHRRAGQTTEAISVLLRSARVPDGQTGRARTASHVRGAMLDVAMILLEDHADNVYFQRDDAWLLLAAAGAQLRTVASDKPLTVTRSFLVSRWQSRVRRLLRRADPPPWFADLAWEPVRDDREALSEFVHRLTHTTFNAKQVTARQRAPIARFGVWLDTTSTEITVR